MLKWKRMLNFYYIKKIVSPEHERIVQQYLGSFKNDVLQNLGFLDPPSCHMSHNPFLPHNVRRHQ